MQPTTTEATAMTPHQIDTQLAALYREGQQLRYRYDMYAASAKNSAGATHYYRGRQRVTDMTLDEARTILMADLAANSDDEYGYGRLRGSSSVGNARHALDGLALYRAKLAHNTARMAALEALYTGWSRFFLVTSSKGHIHSSMCCSTCRPTTTYGWLPDLSGQTEAEAVAAHGPALCSVCYPSAPTEWTQAQLTKAQAERAAA